MKKTAILGLAVVLAAAPAAAYDESDFSALGRMLQPAPEGHVAGKDNGPGNGLHHAGEECGRCHNMGGKAESRPWTMAGTLYADRSGRTVLKGGEIILQDRAGNVISMTSNEVGNFWTTTPIASNPYAVSAHGTTMDILYTLDAQGNLLEPADPDDSRSWQYKAWVRRGAAVRPMMTIAPVGGSTGMFMSCSMHHTRMGSRGALWVSSAPTLPSYPSSGFSYRGHIQPILRSNCAPCHIPGGTKTRLVTKSDVDSPSTSFDFSSGLDLTTYAGSTVGGAAKRGIADVVDTSDPTASRVLQKTARGGTHGGGTFWDERAPDYRALKAWIAEGALDN